MGLFNKTKKNEVQRTTAQSDNPYLGLRQQALEIKPEQLNVTLESDQQVYAAVVDMPVKNGIATLACFFDGTVSLYYSNGGGMLGSGQKYKEVKEAGISFLISSGQALPYLNKADDFDLPKDLDTCVYLLARDAVYKSKFNMNDINRYERPIQFLNFLIQNVLNNVREKNGF